MFGLKVFWTWTISESISCSRPSWFRFWETVICSVLTEQLLKAELGHVRAESVRVSETVTELKDISSLTSWFPLRFNYKCKSHLIDPLSNCYGATIAGPDCSGSPGGLAPENLLNNSFNDLNQLPAASRSLL